MRRLLSVSLLVLLGCLAAPLPVASQKAPAVGGVAACNQALKLIQEGKPKDALKVLDAAKGTMDAEDEWLWWGNRGHAQRDLRQDNEALASYSKAMELKPDCWFRLDHTLLLHEFGRWDEAVKQLEVEVEPEYQALAGAMRTVIEGPFKARWPNAWKKLEVRSKGGRYHVVSDVGLTVEQLDAIEKEITSLDPADKSDQGRVAKLLKPTDDLVALANLAELTRKEYIRFSGARETDFPKGKVAKLFFFNERGDYQSFASSCGVDITDDTVGFYRPSLRYMQLFDRKTGQKYCGISEDTISTFWHEGWHQFFHTLTEQRPIWFDEGLAVFLGYGTIKDKGATIKLGELVRVRGEFLTRYEIIKETINKAGWTSFRRFFRLSPEGWNAGDVDVNYAQAWSIAYYGLSGNNEAFKKDYAKFFFELVKGRNPEELVPEIFTDKKLDQYEKDWLAYWKNI